MTKEILDSANEIFHDIEVLQKIKNAQDNELWVGFRLPNGFNNDIPVDNLWSSDIIDDFKEFVAQEIEKAEKILKEM